MTTVVFQYAPYFALFGFLAARLYRWGIVRDRRAPAVADVSPAAEAALVVGFATLIVGHMTTAVAPGAMRALLSDLSRVAVIETIGLVGAMLFAWGVASRLVQRWRALRAGSPDQVVPVAVLALLFAVCLSGVYLTVSYRWITVWYAYIVVPYTRSLVVLEPVTGAIVASPWALKQHLALFMALLAAWPAAGLGFEEIFPIRSVARRFAEGGEGDAVPEVQS